jgi:Gas vesicle protein K
MKKSAQKSRPRISSPKKTRATKPRARRPKKSVPAGLSLEVRELDALRHEMERYAARAPSPRWNVDPDAAQKSVAKLVLTLVEFLRKLMERQAVRRMEAGTLSDAEIEAVGQALMRLEETVVEMAKRFGVDPAELNLELGPLGRLM